jgi:hypothetical protein
MQSPEEEKIARHLNKSYDSTSKEAIPAKYKDILDEEKYWEESERRAQALTAAVAVYQGTGMGTYENKTTSILTMAKEFERYLAGDKV